MRIGAASAWRLLAAVASGILLALAFPPFGWAGLAWVALIPLLLVLFRTPPGVCSLRQDFRLGFAAGLTFWLISLAWLLRLFDTSPAPAALVVLGWVALSACCAVFLGAFTVTAGWILRRIGLATVWRTSLLTLLLPLIWTGWEMARSTWFTGFPWNLLGISQYRNLALIQCAEWVGAPGVSTVVMLANTGLAFTVNRYLPPRAARLYRPHLELFMALMTVALCFRAGMVMVRHQASTSGEAEIAIAAVQPAIPQVKKWTQQDVDMIHSTLRRLTEETLRAPEGKPDLVVWPETATPYGVTEEGESRELVLQLSRAGSPLLVGALDAVGTNDAVKYYNASFLFMTNGALAGTYYKQHLVPLGEYVPLSHWIPPLADLAPMGWNCEAGSESTVFTLGDPAWSFACLICFEDSIAALARGLVKAGARLLVNQTNDAWFDRTSGPEQHMSHCVFRCVENRVPAVRVGNSGVSCLILPTGAVIDATSNDRSHPPLSTVMRWMVVVPGSEFVPTLYTRTGDWILGFPCEILAVALLGWAVVVSRFRP